MAIIISQKNGKDAEKIEPSLVAEDKIQEYISNHPESIPLSDIDEGTRLFIAAREFSTKSGPIDALGFDINGNIYVVETKLYKNPDKRTVVAQALDYGASLWRHSADFDEFTAQIDGHTQKNFSVSFAEKYADFFNLDESVENMRMIRHNLAEGVIKFVVLMDKLHDDLKDLVVFVNQNSKFDLYAVELEYYEHNEFEIVIPKLFGAEVKKDVASTTKGRQYLTVNEASFWDSVGHFMAVGDLNQNRKEAFVELSDLCKLIAQKTNGQIEYVQKKSSTKDIVALLLKDSEKKVSLYFDSDNSYLGFYAKETGLQNEIIQDLLNSLLDKNLMSRTKVDQVKWFLNLKNTSDSDMRELLNIFKDVTTKHLESI